MLIDDNPRYAVECAQAGIHVSCLLPSCLLPSCTWLGLGGGGWDVRHAGVASAQSPCSMLAWAAPGAPAARSPPLWVDVGSMLGAQLKPVASWINV